MAAKGFTPTLTNGDITVPTAPGTYAERVDEEVRALWARGHAAVVRCVAVANVALANGLEATDTIDSVTLAAGDLVLLTGQSSTYENGIYKAVASGAASRHIGFEAYNDHPGLLVSVQEGTTYADTLWRCNSNRGGTLGVTAITFAKILGTAASQDTGTSGANVPLLNANNTHSGNNIFTGTFSLIHASSQFPFQIQTSYAGAAQLPLLNYNGATNDAYDVAFQFLDSAASPYQAVLIRSTQLDNTNGSEDSNLELYTVTAGAALAKVFDFRQRPYATGSTTTASAANAFLNSGSSPANELMRSTSSLRYKTAIEPLDPARADAILQMQPIYYRSIADGDVNDPIRKDWSYYGLAAEELAAIEPRLVNWGYADEDYETVLDLSERVTKNDEGEVVARTPIAIQRRELKPGAQLKPDGVAYDRLTVMLLDIVKRQEARIAALEATRR